jgi:septum formation protein
MNGPYKIVLASKSPRRIELLGDLGLEFTVMDTTVDESYPDHLVPEQVPLFLAGKKHDFALISQAQDDIIFITADTVVICEGEILGKPADREDAVEKLRKISGKSHVVVTGVCIGNKTRRSCFDDRTEVFVEFMTDAEIIHYIDNFNVFDKAGAYGIQDWLGIAKISSITGSYTNVIGLPTQKLWKEINFFMQKES